MQRSIATRLRPAPFAGALRTAFQPVKRWLNTADATQIGLFFVLVALGVYVFSNPSRSGFYNHFVWQADAFLHGRFVIAYPVTEGPFTNGYFQDVMPIPSAPGQPSYGLLPFPPLPALILTPFVAIFGLATDSQLVGVIIGAINVGLAWRMTTRLTDVRAVSFLATLFFAFGTVHWYAAMLSTTWFLAHVVAVTFVLLGITLCLDAERRESLRTRLDVAGRNPVARGSSRPVVTLFEGSSLFLAWYRRLREHIDPMQFMAGFVFGVGALARLPVIFGAPFFLFVGGGGSFLRRGLSAGLGAAIPVVLLLSYTFIATGHLFNPAYEHLYQTEYLGYLPPGELSGRPPTVTQAVCPFYLPLSTCEGLTINRELGIEDVGHVPVNMLIMLGWTPIFQPECGLSLLRPDCAVLRPDAIGMSVLLTSPAFLLAVPLALTNWRKRIVAGSLLAIAAIAFVNLMHFSQGWVQFGYRFSNDFAPFALVLVTLGIASMRNRLGLATALVVASIIINAWGVYWGVVGGW